MGLLALLLVAAAGYLLGLRDLLRARRTVPPPQRPVPLAFDAQDANGDRHIWIIPADGCAARQLTKQAGEQSAPTWSHDGQWIYFSHNDSGRHEVWRVRSTGGGTPEQISRSGSGVIAFESPDGQHVIYKLGDQDAPIVEASLNGDGSRILVPCVSSFWGFSVVRESLYYMPCAPARAGTIRVLDLATRRDLLWAVVPDVSLVPNVESAYLWDLAISPDGTSLLPGP